MIRLYKKEDIPQIVELEKENLLCSLDEEYYIQDLKNPLARHYVWIEDKKIVGFVSSIFDGSLLEILNLVIHKSYQSMGYGTRLLKSVFDELLANGLERIILEVRKSNQKAIRLYEKFDFRVVLVRQRYYSNGEDALVMLKEFK